MRPCRTAWTARASGRTPSPRTPSSRCCRAEKTAATWTRTSVASDSWSQRRRISLESERRLACCCCSSSIGSLSCCRCGACVWFASKPAEARCSRGEVKRDETSRGMEAAGPCTSRRRVESNSNSSSTADQLEPLDEPPVALLWHSRHRDTTPHCPRIPHFDRPPTTHPPQASPQPTGRSQWSGRPTAREPVRLSVSAPDPCHVIDATCFSFTMPTNSFVFAV